MQPGYPADFELMFGEFGSNVTEIDAVYERPDDGRIVIFSGSQVEDTNQRNFVECYNISEMNMFYFFLLFFYLNYKFGLKFQHLMI